MSENVSKPKLKRKHVRVIKNHLGGMNKRESWKKEYKCTDISAQTGAYRLFSKPEVKNEIARILGDSKNMSLETVVNAVGKDLKAKKQVIYNNKGDIKEIRDNDTRGKAQDKLLKLHKAPGFTKDVHIEGSKTVNINLGAADVSKLGSILAELKALGSAGSTVDEGQTDGEVIDITPVVE